MFDILELKARWKQADGLAPGCTDLRSPHTCIQHLAITSATQRWQALPKPGHAGGTVVMQTGRLCCLAQARLRDRQLSHVWWLPKLIYQSPPSQVLKALWRCHRYRALTSALTNKRGSWEMATHLFYGLVPSEWTRPLTLESTRQHCETGSRTTLETKIVMRETWDLCPSVALLKSQRDGAERNLLQYYLQDLHCNALERRCICVVEFSSVRV